MIVLHTLRKHPRLRGEDLYIHGVPPMHFGNTPAYAGKTRKHDPDVLVLKKHPRLRGEDFATTSLSSRTSETPPLTRGRLFFFRHPGGVSGNTPAYAGKTNPSTTYLLPT